MDKSQYSWSNGTEITFHVLGVGHAGHPTGHQHTFHLHAHRWLNPGTNNIIDVKQIMPGKTHSFIIDVGEGVGPDSGNIIAMYLHIWKPV